MAEDTNGLSMQTLLAQIVGQAGSANGVTDIFHRLADLSYMRYGEEVFKNKHIKKLSTLPTVLRASPATESAGKHTTGTGVGENNGAGQKAKVTGLAKKAPVLDLLLSGRSKLAYNPKEEATVLRLVQENLAARCDDRDHAVRARSDGQLPAIIFSGRSKSGTRFNFDHTADGLQATLRDLYAVEGPSGSLPYRIEAALKTFVRWNPDLFPELAGHKYSRTTPGPYTCTFDVLRVVDGLAEPPTEPERWADFCVHLFGTVKQRVVDKCPSSALLQQSPRQTKGEKKGANNFSLADSPGNFLRTLTRCLSYKNVTPENLDAVLEVQVYKLAEREPEAFPEVFNAVALERTDESSDEEMAIAGECPEDAALDDDNHGGVVVGEEMGIDGNK